MSKRTASDVDEEFLINNVHMRTNGSLPFQRQKTTDSDSEQREQSNREVAESSDNAINKQFEEQGEASEEQVQIVVPRQKHEQPQRRTSISGSDYDQFFLVRNEIKFRKAAYLSVANHDAISRIVKELGNGQLSVGGYLDLIVTAHLEQYRERINALYRARKVRDDLI